MSGWVIFGRVIGGLVAAVVVWAVGMAVLHPAGLRLSPVAVAVVFAVLGPAAAALVAGPGRGARIGTAVPLVVLGLWFSSMAMSKTWSIDERYERDLDRIDLTDSGFTEGSRSRTGNNICVDVCTVITDYYSIDGDLAEAEAALRKAARAAGLRVRATDRGDTSARFEITGADHPLRVFVYERAGLASASVSAGEQG